jgi:hypothetical protein
LIQSYIYYKDESAHTLKYACSKGKTVDVIGSYSKVKDDHEVSIKIKKNSAGYYQVLLKEN